MRSTLFFVLAGCGLLMLSNAGLLQANNVPPDRIQQSPQIQKPQSVCPVMGGPIDKGIYVDAKGKRIYLCCAACEEAVRVEPDKYLKKIKDRGETADDTPEAN